MVFNAQRVYLDVPEAVFSREFSSVDGRQAAPLGGHVTAAWSRGTISRCDGGKFE